MATTVLSGNRSNPVLVPPPALSDAAAAAGERGSVTAVFLRGEGASPLFRPAGRGPAPAARGRSGVLGAAVDLLCQLVDRLVREHAARMGRRRQRLAEHRLDLVDRPAGMARRHVADRLADGAGQVAPSVLLELPGGAITETDPCAWFHALRLGPRAEQKKGLSPAPSAGQDWKPGQWTPTLRQPLMRLTCQCMVKRSTSAPRPKTPKV